MVARSGVDPASPNVLIPVTPVVLNGDPSPRFVWKAGERHRVRLINIAPGDIFTVSLRHRDRWRGRQSPDGAPMPQSARTAAPARQTIAVGETYDFELDLAQGRQTL